MNKLAEIIRKAIKLDEYRNELKRFLVEEVETEALGYWLKDYVEQQELDRLYEQIQAEYVCFDDAEDITDIFSHDKAYFNKEIYEMADSVIDKALQNYLKKQEHIIDSFKILMRSITSPLDEKQFIEYLEKPDTKLGKYWSITQRYAVEGESGNQYTFVIERPRIEDIEMIRTLEVRILLEITEDEITLKPNTEVKLIKLLDEDGKEINLPSSVKNKIFRI